MVVQLGLPEGKNLRLQEAVTWAFTGWSWSNSTATLVELSAIERRDDFPALGSLYSLMPSVPPEQSLERDGSLFSRFDRLLSDACFRGDVVLTARRRGTTQFEQIPCSYFFKARGLSYFYGTKIDDTPANASLEEIIGSQRDGEWEDAFVDRDQFVGWLTRFVEEITGQKTLLVQPETAPTSSDERAAAVTTAAMVKHAIQHAAKLLRNSPNLTKKDVFTSVKNEIGHVSDNQLKVKVWPDAREVAGLPRKATPGPKRSVAG